MKGNDLKKISLLKVHSTKLLHVHLLFTHNVLSVIYNMTCVMQLHYTPYTVQWTVNSVLCTLYTVHCTVYLVHCTPYSVHCTLYSVHCTLYTVLCTLYTLHCTLYTVHCTCAATDVIVSLDTTSDLHPYTNTIVMCTGRRARTHWSNFTCSRRAPKILLFGAQDTEWKQWKPSLPV